MKLVGGLVAMLLSLALISPASAEEASYQRGMSADVACVTQLPTGTRGWQVGSGMRFWNAAQPYVHLTRRQLGEACGTIYVGTYDAAPDEPHGDDVAFTQFPGWDDGAWSSSAWFYPDAMVTFNDWHRNAERGTDNFKCRKRMIVAHELGHALGLNHTDDPASVMNITSLLTDGLCITSPQPSDRTALDAIYVLR